MMHRKSEELDTMHDSRSVTVRVLPGGSVKAVTTPPPVVKVESVPVPPVSAVHSSAEGNKRQNVDSVKSNEEQFPALPKSKPVAVPKPTGMLKYKRNLTAAVKNNMAHKGYKYGD